MEKVVQGLCAALLVLVLACPVVIDLAAEHLVETSDPDVTLRWFWDIPGGGTITLSIDCGGWDLGYYNGCGAG